MTQVVFVTVHFHNGADVQRLIENIAALRLPAGWNAEVIVVDNSSDAPPLAGATVVLPASNLGYLGGAAFGLHEWVESRGALPEWVAVVNPDIELVPDALENLAAATPGSSVLAVAPSVRLEGTTEQNPFFRSRPSRFRMWLYTVIFRSGVLTGMLDMLLAAKRRRAGSAGPVETIYAAHGSALLLRKSFFERGGTLRYGGFMYGEEIHIAEQVRAAGGSILFLPAVAAVHRGGATTARVGSRQRRLWHLQSARVLWDEYFR